MKPVSVYITPRTVGILLILASIFLLFIVYTYTQNILALSAQLHKDCPLPESVCPYKRSMPYESYVGFTLSALVGILGGYTLFSEKQIERMTSVERTKMKQAAKSLQGEEKKIYDILYNTDGSAFQTDLVSKSGFSKVKVSRILDRLETKSLIERRRRGMSNMVVLKG